MMFTVAWNHWPEFINTIDYHVRYLIEYNGLDVNLDTDPYALTAQANPDDFLFSLEFESRQNKTKSVVDFLVTAHPNKHAKGQQCRNIWSIMYCKHAGRTLHLAPLRKSSIIPLLKLTFMFHTFTPDNR